jgi:hypothetical protein
MKKALISPNEAPIKHIVAWDLNPVTTDPRKYLPVFENYPNSCRVAQVEDESFPVAEPLFWVDCADDIVADEFYYDTQDSTIKPIVNEPIPPAEDQPDTNGTQTL